MFTSEDFNQLENIPSANKKKLPLAPGDDMAESPWRNLYNVRLQVEGHYVYWKTRGGSTLVNSFFGNVLTVEPVQMRVSGVTKEYLAVHTAAGHVYLWDIAADTSNEIANSLFSTSQQVQFANIGRLLFIFDYDGGTAKYYDVTSDTLSDFLSYDKSYLHGISYAHEDFTEENILDFEVGQSIIVFQNSTNTTNFASYESEIDTIEDSGDALNLSFNDPDGNTVTATLGGASDSELKDKNLVFPKTPDTEDLIGKPASKQSDGSGGTEANDKYEAPSIYRQYVVIDMLADGSITIAGKPFQAEVSTPELLKTPTSTVRLSVTPAGSNISKRFLCSTRWHSTPDRAFIPSSPEYSNSPLFIIGEVRPQNAFLTDETPDSKLLRGIDELYPVTAGVADVFASGQVSPNSITQFQGSLMLAGYTIDRPVPKPYTNAAGATDENVFVDIEQTTQLPNDMALAFQFEYPDGKKSSIVETEQFLQEGFSTETVQVACDQTKASGNHTVTQGTQEDGDIDITYDGITTRVSLTVASHPAPEDVASAIVAALDADGDQRIDPSIGDVDEVVYTEKRWGEEFNGDVVDVAAVPTAGTGEINVTANNLVQSPAEGWLDVTANNLGSGGNEPHQITIGAEQTNSITINDTDTLEEIVDKYVTEINSGGNITTGWTASKVDNGDGTWRCLITSDTSDESDNGTTISVDNVDVAVTEQNAQGGNDGEESHAATVGATATASFTVLHTDSIEDIAQKYVDQINGDGTISADWTASKVDSGDGTWKCLITSDTKGAADNGTTISVSKSDTVSGGSQVDSTSSDTDGGSDGAGITFDTRDPSLSGGAEPTGTKARAFIAAVGNYVSEEQSVRGFVDGEQTDDFSVVPDQSLTIIISTMASVINDNSTISADWTASGAFDVTIDGEQYPAIEVVADEYGTEWNGKEVSAGGTSTAGVDFKVSAPGGSWALGGIGTETAGGAEGCTQATASIDVDANNLGSGASEDHTLTIDGNDTAPITIADTDTPEDIVDKYIAEIGQTIAIDLDWKAEKVDSGDGTWTLKLRFRLYGATGNDRAVSVAGNTDVSLTLNSPSSGGSDAGETVSGDPVEQVNANRLQIHSLNQLISKAYILGRTNDGATEFHLIREVSITSADAHGKIINLPNTASALDEIENTIYQPPTDPEKLESVELPDHLVVGTPFQQFQISTQEQIVDQSEIQRAMAVDFASDTTVMRYRVLIFTDRNIQLGYLVDQTSTSESGRTRRTFEGDFEIIFAGMKTSSREGISDIFGRIIFPTEDGMYAWPRDGSPKRLFDVRRYEVSADNNLVDVIYNQDHDEFWFIYEDTEIVVYDFDSQSTRRMSYSGVGAIRAGAFFGDKLYIGSGTDVLETDVDTATTDKSAGDPVAAKVESGHLGSELLQTRLLELIVGGQELECAVDIDLQPARFEDDNTTWSDQFNADKTLPAKTLDVAGASFQVQRTAIMPRLRLSFDAVANGRLSHVILKSVSTQNKGKARQ